MSFKGSKSSAAGKLPNKGGKKSVGGKLHKDNGNASGNNARAGAAKD